MATANIELAGAAKSSRDSAATWAMRFYPGVEVTFGEQSATIRSDQHDARQLERIWKAALLNERLVEAAAQGRRQTLEILFQ